MSTVVSNNTLVMVDQIFKGRKVIIDNMHFEGCTFEDCIFYYSGGPHYFINCKLIDVTINFIGTAWNTISMLNKMNLDPKLLAKTEGVVIGKDEDKFDLATVVAVGGKH